MVGRVDNLITGITGYYRQFRNVFRPAIVSFVFSETKETLQQNHFNVAQNDDTYRCGNVCVFIVNNSALV